MSALREIRSDLTPGVSVVERPEDLGALHAPGNAAVIWWRRPLPEGQAWLDGLDPAQLPRGRVILRPDAVRAAVAALCDGAGTPAGGERARLTDDIAALADMFAGVMEAPYLRLRLDVVTGNACRRFHVDAITARLVCTYRGTGTQYGIAREGQEPARVFTTPTGAPILLRGKLWPVSGEAGPSGARLLHRSPPIEGSGETRLVLVLDPLTEPEDDI